jgi:hypothetical protein
LSSVRDTTQAWARNPINGLSAPQSLVGILAGYQTRPRFQTCATRRILLACAIQKKALDLKTNTLIGFGKKSQAD